MVLPLVFAVVSKVLNGNYNVGSALSSGVSKIVENSRSGSRSSDK